MWFVYGVHRRRRCLFGALAGIDFSWFFQGIMARQGLPGDLSFPCLVSAGCSVWVWCFALAHRCLTISSEERETWAAVFLRFAEGRALCFWARRENCTDGHVSRFTAFLVFGLGAGCFLGLVEAAGLLGLAVIVISRVRGFRVGYNLRV